MASYYVAEGGTAANKAAATTGTYPGGCMNVSVHNGETFAADDVINFSDEGGLIRATVAITTSGTSGHPVLYQVKSGDSPIIVGSEDLTGATYRWTASGSGSNEYYCELAGGGDPSLVEPATSQVFLDGVRLTEGTIGSLADHEWVWGDNDTLGYNTVYIADATGDPDTSGVAIEASQRDNCLTLTNCDYVEYSGIDCKYGNNRGITVTGGEYWELADFTTSYHKTAGMVLWGGPEDSTISGVTTEYNWGDGFGVAIDAAPYAYRITYTGCTIRENLADGELRGSGIKAFGLHQSTIEKCTVYNNEFGGIRPDGGETQGCDDNIIQWNHCYGNGTTSPANLPQIYVEFSARNIIRWNHCHDGFDDGILIGISHTRCDDNVVYGNILHGVAKGWAAAIAVRWSAAGTLIYGNTIYDCDIGIYTTGGSDYTIKNNIVSGSSRYDLCFGSGEESEVTSDYNCFSGDGTDAVREYGGSAYTVAGWFAQSGNDEHSIEEDPDLNDAAGGEFWPKASSPCVDAGVDLGSSYSDAIDPFSTWPDGGMATDQDDHGSAWEIGAYVFYVGSGGTLTYDCEGLSQGAALPGWDLFEGGGSAYVDTTGGVNAWSFNPSPADSRLLYDNTDSGPLTDSIVTMKLRYSDNRAFSFIHCRSNGLTGGSADSYLLMFANAVLKIYRRDNGSYTQLDEATITTTSSPATFYHMRFEATGTTLRGRAWEDGDTEPTTWDVSATDSAYSSGYVLMGGDYAGYYDDIVIQSDDLSAGQKPELVVYSSGAVTLTDNYDTLISAVAGTVSDDDDVVLVVDGANAEIFVNGTSVGSTAAVVTTTGTAGEVDSANGLQSDHIACFPRDVSGLLPKGTY